MQRWVNDYRIAEKIYLGYRPVLPLDVKPVGDGVFGMLMETPDADYKAQQKNKQIKNDILSEQRGALGGIDLARYVEQELRGELRSMTAWDTFKLFLKKAFRT